LPFESVYIDFEPKIEILRIGDFVFCHKPWPIGAKGVAALALIPLASSSS